MTTTPTNGSTLGSQGDSGFVCVRDGAIIRQSEPLQHFFDCPFQFAAVPRAHQRHRLCGGEAQALPRLGAC